MEESVRYVTAGTPNGWAAMAKTIRDVDEGKVNDCKEDIDTLLVFTGLFTAVLTAFVIESYQALSPDKQDAIIQLLGQIASQNTTLSPSQSSLPPFEPPLSALRANQLWFASLILTLVIASFAMLVKQWLREYLAMDYTSPHERLRARQFRHPGLSTWKVYEIAGVLPLLLQLALGLFLLGLCYFTYSVNLSLGDMSATLVSAWAFLFGAAIFGPLYSPQCPYKTTILKHAIIFLRRHIRGFLHPTSVQSGLETISRAATLGSLFNKRCSEFCQGRFFIEETEAIRLDTDELTILQEVDTFLLDDDLLGTTICDSLMQSSPDPSTVIKFLVQAVNLRVSGLDLHLPLLAAPDLRRLTKRGWIAVSDIVASLTLNHVSKPTTNMGSWLEDALFLLLSSSNQPLTPKACFALVRCVQRATADRFLQVLQSVAATPHTIGRIHVMLCLLEDHVRWLLSHQDARPSDIVVLVLKFHSLETRRSEHMSPLCSILDLRSLSEPLWNFSSNALAAAIEHSLGLGRRESRSGCWLEDAIYILLSLSNFPLTPAGAHALALLCSERAPHTRFSECIRRLVSPTSPHYSHAILRLHAVCQRLPSDTSANWLLREIVYSTSCTAHCVHPSSHYSLSFALALAEHGPHYREWTRSLTAILVERVQSICQAEYTWPPGATESLYAILSLPPALVPYPETSELIFTIICSENTCLSALLPLISVRDVDRSRIHADRAVQIIRSLVVGANAHGRLQFLASMQSLCTAYVSAWTDNGHYTECNIVRLAALVSTVHSHIHDDKTLDDKFASFYSKCADAIAIFRAHKYSFLTGQEKASTATAAKMCLELLDNMGSILESSDGPRDALNTDVSAIPDDIFQELAVVVDDETALMFRRVQQLRRTQGAMEPAAEAHVVVVEPGEDDVALQEL